MIPQHEIFSLAMVVTEALSHAEAGAVGEGYTLLEQSYRDTRAELQHEPWWPELSAEWSREIDLYCQRYCAMR